MGKCVEVIRHDACGSSRLQVFEQEDGTYDGYCFGCGTPVSNPYKDKGENYKPARKTKTKEEIEEELRDIQTYPCFDLPARGLKKAALDYFGVKIGMSTADGQTPEVYCFPYNKGDEIVGYKIGTFKLAENGKKRLWSVGSLKEADFFGWDKAIATGSKRLFITEGEFDAIALFQIFKRQQHGTQYEDSSPAIVSLKSGAHSASNTIQQKIQEIRRYFKEVVLVFDMDAVGQAAATEVVKNNPDFLVANLPCKDVNEGLMRGHVKATFNACQFNATKVKNTRLVWGSSLHEAGRKEAEWGLSWPWKKLTDLTRGIRFGETYYLGAGVKMGKSEIVNAIGAHFITEHKMKVLMAKPEEANAKTYKMVVGKVAGRIFHDPKIPFDYAAYDEASKLVGDNLCVINLYQHMGWDTLKGDIREAASQGVKAVFIDPITNLTVGLESGAANSKLQEIAVELSSMALDLQLAIFIFCHLKAPESGLPHEKGGAVMSHQFAGSRSMMR